LQREVVGIGSLSLASWAGAPNLVILSDSQLVGLLRLVQSKDGVGPPETADNSGRQGGGIGSAWAVERRTIATSRIGFHRLLLRV
jgi:hypothetical protein